MKNTLKYKKVPILCIIKDKFKTPISWKIENLAMHKLHKSMRNILFHKLVVTVSSRRIIFIFF